MDDERGTAATGADDNDDEVPGAVVAARGLRRLTPVREGRPMTVGCFAAIPVRFSAPVHRSKSQYDPVRLQWDTVRFDQAATAGRSGGVL